MVCEDRILKHLIQTINNQALIQKAINKKWNLTQPTEAAQTEDTLLQVSDMKIPEEIKMLSQHRERRRTSRNRPARKPEKAGLWLLAGQTGIHPEGKNCPAYGKKC